MALNVTFTDLHQEAEDENDGLSYVRSGKKNKKGAKNGRLWESGGYRIWRYPKIGVPQIIQLSWMTILVLKPTVLGILVCDMVDDISSGFF